MTNVNKDTLAELAKIVIAIFRHSLLYFEQSREERRAIYAELGAEGTSIIAAVDWATTQCAGYAVSIEKNISRDSKQAVTDLRKVKILRNNDILKWIEKYGADKPLFSAHVYSSEVLRHYLIAYHEENIDLLRGEDKI